MTDWFVPRRYGYGATPVRWQGWAVVAALAILLIALFRWRVAWPVRVLLAMLAASAVLLAWRKTDGQWRWRWGGRG